MYSRLLKQIHFFSMLDASNINLFLNQTSKNMKKKF